MELDYHRLQVRYTRTPYKSTQSVYLDSSYCRAPYSNKYLFYIYTGCTPARPRAYSQAHRICCHDCTRSHRSCYLIFYLHTGIELVLVV